MTRRYKWSKVLVVYIEYGYLGREILIRDTYATGSVIEYPHSVFNALDSPHYQMVAI